MYQTVTNDFIISTISGYKEELILIERRIDVIRRTLSDEKEMIIAASLPGVNNKDDVPASPFERDLQAVHERYQKLCRMRDEDGIAYITELYEKRKSMDRVMAAYELLPETERRALDLVYVQHKDLRVTEAVDQAAQTMYLSTRQIERIRKKAFDRIRTIYESSRSLTEIRLDALAADTAVQNAVTA